MQCTCSAVLRNPELRRAAPLTNWRGKTPAKLKSLICCLLFIVSGTGFIGNANAALFMSFTTPDATVGPHDEIPVWLTLATDTGFNYDASDPDNDMTYGGVFDPANLPTSAYFEDANGGAGGEVVFTDVLSTHLSLTYWCTGNFTSGGDNACSPGDNYDLSWNIDGIDYPSLVGGQLLSIEAGASQMFLFGVFQPVAGGAAAGTYNATRISLDLRFVLSGYDDLGVEFQYDDFGRVLAATCGLYDTSCDFTRTVVPVPPAIWLFGTSLLWLAGIRVRRLQS